MTESSYWDQMGVSWRAFDPDLNAIARRLTVRLRLHTVGATALLALGVPLSVGLLALGGFTVWVGASTGTWNFVTRGIALIVISVLLACASWSQRVSTQAERSALAQMLDLAIQRTEKLRRAALAGLVMCAVAAAFGIAGYVIRVHAGRAPAMSPLEPLALLTLATVALALYQRRATDDLRKLRYLKTALVPEEEGATTGRP